MKVLATLALFLLASGLASARDDRLSDDCLRGIADRNECCALVPDAPLAHLRNPADCATYYHCDNGIPVLRPCAPTGTHWSVEEDQCDWPDIAGCDASNPSTPRPSSTTEPTSPTPTNSQPTSSEPSPTQPSSPSRPDLPPGCDDGSTSADICCEGVSDWWVHLPDPEDCGRFYQCDNGLAVHKDCPADLHWSVSADRCEWPSIAGCVASGSSTSRPSSSSRPSTSQPTSSEPSPTQPSSPSRPDLPPGCDDGSTSADICCEGVSDWWVHLPDPEDCGRFYQCDNGLAVHKDCPAGLHWSVSADRCEWPSIAGCVASGSSTSRPSSSRPSTSQPTSSEPSPTQPSSPSRPDLPPGCDDGSTSADICCEGVSDWWVHLPDPEDCGRFYQCDNGLAVHKDCPAGLHWSVSADRCEWPSIAGCVASGSSTSRPSSSRPSTSQPTSSEPSPTQPSSPSRPDLPPGCDDGSTSADICCEGVSDWWVHLPDPEDCGRFYQCDNGVAVHKDCPADLHWSVSADRCEWPSIAGCVASGSSTSRPSSSSRPSTSQPTSSEPSPTQPSSPSRPDLPPGCEDGSTSADICCEGVSDWWVHLPDPEDCGRFYQCDNGLAVHKDCPAGLHWSVSADRCEWPAIAGCVASSSSTTRPSSSSRPTTPQPTSPELSSTESSSSTSPTNPSTVPTPNDDECAPPPACKQCITGVFPANLCCQGVRTYYKLQLANRDSCSSYYQCVNGNAVLRECPIGLHWSIHSERCEHPQDAKCEINDGEDESSTSVEETTSSGDGSGDVSEDCLYGKISAEDCCRGVPPTVDVLLQNNDNCHTYFQCVHGSPWVRPCPANLRWSVTYNRCEWFSRATCQW